MINFFKILTFRNRLFITLFLFLLFTFSGTAQQQATGSTYCTPSESTVTLETTSPACSYRLVTWTSKFCLASPSCASQQGLFQFNLVSNYEMSNVTVYLENSSGEFH